jgi:hypothetical protein
MAADDRSWVSDDELEALALERSVHSAETNMQLANRIFDEFSPHAAKAIISLARSAGSERIRLDAAKYVVDRVCGRIGEAKVSDAKDDPVANLYADITREATEAEIAAIERAKGKLA